MIEIAGYESFELIGRGGFAVVYKARQISVGRHVAIKLLSDPSPDADLVRRFERESKAVGALSWHPHIAAVVDAGTTDSGQAYIVFELLTGGSLDDHIEQAPLAWTEAVNWMIHVADAVEAAHHEDVLHRDIKPANILVNRLGNAKLADFGIASMQDGNKTETGMLATTVSHAAPELFDGAPSSRATDIYAMGSTLHNLVTGRPPFNPTDGERIATIIKRIALEAPPQPDPSLVPPQLTAVIAHALAKQPEYRPRSAAAFGQALQAVQREFGLAVTAMPVADKLPVERARDTLPRVATPPPNQQAPSQHAPNQQPPSHHAPNQQAPNPQAPNQQAPGQHAPNQPQPLGQQAQPPHQSGRHPQHAAQVSGRTEPKRSAGSGIVALIAIAVLLAAGIAGALLFNARTGTEPLFVTAGGATIVDINVLDDTQMSAFPGRNAIDGDTATYWGIEPNIAAERNIAGTTFVIRFDEPITIGQVGISNGASTDFGRISHINWGTSVTDFNENASTNVLQNIPDEPGEHLTSFRLTTDQLALAITDVHDLEALTAGIAEILIVVDQ